MTRISRSLLHGDNADRLVHWVLDLSFLAGSRKRSGAAMSLMGLVIFLLACTWADAGEQSGPAPPANSKAPATSEKPKYLIFWNSPRKPGN